MTNFSGSNMVLETITLEGYDALKKVLDGSKTRTAILFTGSKDTSGKSWCPDCVAVIESLSASSFAAQNNVRFVECRVGLRE
ncbi:unnamed protein product [Anisakis simplex]|uniref:Thioredoxin domain-containing protein 17 n=1 Tax=Anisakis simplex TaxID=6269 RepID=A0A0M3JA03_ANISI|nr:unnamed protein product [Anisakis simplex]